MRCMSRADETRRIQSKVSRCKAVCGHQISSLARAPLPFHQPTERSFDFLPVLIVRRPIELLEQLLRQLQRNTSFKHPLQLRLVVLAGHENEEPRMVRGDYVREPACPHPLDRLGSSHVQLAGGAHANRQDMAVGFREQIQLLLFLSWFSGSCALFVGFVLRVYFLFRWAPLLKKFMP